VRKPPSGRRPDRDRAAAATDCKRAAWIVLVRGRYAEVGADADAHVGLDHAAVLSSVVVMEQEGWAKSRRCRFAILVSESLRMARNVARKAEDYAES
jgi:hypothetical protein